MQIPLHPADIPTEWLTDTLRAAGTLAAARVSAIEIELLRGDKGTTGQLARLRLSYGGDSAAAPASLIAKFSATDPQARALIHGMGFYEREVRFYEQLAHRSPLHTPRCYFSALDLDTGVALLLLEDLAFARNGNTLMGCSLAEAELAVQAIASLHAAWWQHPQLGELGWLELRSLVSIQQAPVIVQQAWQPFLDRMGAGVTDELLQVGEWLMQYMRQLSGYLFQEQPCTLVHNDYQADNLFFSGEGRALALTVADWQLATRGRGVLDVAGLLGSNLDPQDRRTHEQRLLQTYYESLVANGIRSYSFEQCWDDYRLAVIFPLSRVVTIVGIGAAPHEQERGYCEVLVPRLCRAAHELRAGDILHSRFGHA